MSTHKVQDTSAGSFHQHEMGRRALSCFLSLMLVTSLVPTPPSVAFATEEGGEAVPASTEQTPSPSQDQPEPSQPQEQPAEQPQQPEEQPQQQPAEQPAAQPSDADTQPQKPSDAQSTPAPKPVATPKPDPVTKEPANAGTDNGQGNDESKDPQNNEPSPTKAPAAKASFTASLEGDALGGSYYASRTVVVDVKDLEETPTIRVAYTFKAKGSTDAENKQSTSPNPSISLTEPGTYSNIEVTVDGIDGSQKLNETFTVVDSVKPQIDSVVLKDVNGDTIGVEGGTGALDLKANDWTDPIVKHASAIWVTVTDDALNTGESQVSVFDGTGKELGKFTFEKSKENDGEYVAKIGGVNGRIALDIHAEGYAQSSATTDAIVGGVNDGGVLKGSQRLVVDTKAPKLEGNLPTSASEESLAIEVIDEYLNTDAAKSSLKLMSGDDVKAEASFEYESDSNNKYKATMDLSGVAEGTYTLALVAEDTLINDSLVSGQHAKLEKSTEITIDRTAPKITSIKAGDEEVKSRKQYQSNELTITFNEKQDTAQAIITLSGQSGLKPEWAEDGCSCVVSGIPEGTYTLEIQPVDVAGNKGDKVTHEEVTLDNQAPVIGEMTFNDPKFYTDSEGVEHIVIQPGEATLQITDVNFAKNGVEVEGLRKRSDTVSWNDEGVGTFTFSGAGARTIRITAEDSLGNKSETKTIAFVVAGELQATVNPATIEVNEDGYSKSEVALEVTITGKQVDEATTKVAGVSLKDILDHEVKTEKLEITKATHDEDAGTYTATVTYKQGAHKTDLPVVSAFDWRGTEVKAGEFDEFTVDTEAPEVLVSVVRGNRQNQHYVYGGANNKDQTVFFNVPGTGDNAGAQLRYTIRDNYGIKEVTLSNDDGYTETFEITNPKEIGHTLTLKEENAFTRNSVLEVTDVAGHMTTWTLAQTQADDEAAHENELMGIQSPLELIEDHTKPVLEISGPKSNGSYTENTIEDIVLQIKEKNYGYLKQYDLNQVVLTVTKDGETEPFIQKVVGDATGSDDLYTITVNSSDLDEGVYNVSAELTDLAGNKSNKVEIKDFSVDLSDPSISISNPSVDPSVSYDNLGENSVYKDLKPTTATTFTVTTFKEKPSYTVKIVERFLNAEESTVNGISLKTLQDNPSYTAGNITYKYSKSKSTYTIVVTYDEGEYKALEVTAVDKHDRETKAAIDTAIVVDTTPPVVQLTGIEDKDENKIPYYNSTQEVTLNVTERSLKYLRGFGGLKGLEPTRAILDITHVSDTGVKMPTNSYTVSDLKAVEGNEDAYELKLPFKADFDSHKDDGLYSVHAHVEDVVGHKDEASISNFVIDTKKPTISVEWNTKKPKQTVGGTQYFDHYQVATITVNEHNFDPDAMDVLVTEENVNLDEEELNLTMFGDTYHITEWENDGDVHTRFVYFEADGEYSLRVDGEDKAGNQAEPYESPTFVIDSEAPQIGKTYSTQQEANHDEVNGLHFDLENHVVLPTPIRTYNNINYYNQTVRIKASVKDRNLNIGTPAKTATIVKADGKKQNVTWSNPNYSRTGYGYAIHKATVTYSTEGTHTTPEVFAKDFALNSSNNSDDLKTFILDSTAPGIEVTLEGDGGRGPQVVKDKIEFYNKNIKLNFKVTDTYGMWSAIVTDPNNTYSKRYDSKKNAKGSKEYSFSIDVKSGSGTASPSTTEFDDVISLTVEDIAGNRHIWTLKKNGKVVESTFEAGVTNDPIHDDAHPQRVVEDTIAPRVSLSGVTAGQYYNSPQTVVATVEEYNFDYIKDFDPSREIVSGVSYSGDASRTQSTMSVSAKQFGGKRPTYTYNIPFASDGHYTLRSQFRDYATNLSNLAEIGEFTIDMTAPVITVTFDNNDAHNGNYYNAGRTATITVEEHNFDPSLITIETGGAIGGWSSNGDTHTITVSFGGDGTYTLTVGGRDMAGNEAAPFTEPEFVIDLTAPQINFGGRVQRYGVNRGEVDEKGEPVLENSYDGDIQNDGEAGDDETLQDHHAYNGVVMPTIEFVDQVGGGATNYSSADVTYTLTANKHGDVKELYYPTQSAVNGGEVYQLPDLGLIAEAATDDGRNVYDPEADDIYTITAHMADLAGNEAEGSITFSVNRYGSNYVVRAYDVENGEKTLIEPAKDGESGNDYDLLSSAPRIEVSEINVSGSESEADHSVLKEYANATTEIDAVKEDDARKDGYVLEELQDTEVVSDYGWSEYRYTIREGNFGLNSASDNGDGGQGVYRVNVASVDRASNDKSTADYLNAEDYQKVAGDAGTAWAMPEESMAKIAGSMRNGTATFTLDQLAPVIDELNVPNVISIGQSYRGSVHVTDAITSGDTVTIYLDGRALSPDEYTAPNTSDGTGTYEFDIPTNYIPFSTHEVRVEATDSVSGREPAVLASERFMVTILVPEIAVIALGVGAIIGAAVFIRKRRGGTNGETTGTYE